MFYAIQYNNIGQQTSFLCILHRFVLQIYEHIDASRDNVRTLSRKADEHLPIRNLVSPLNL